MLRKFLLKKSHHWSLRITVAPTSLLQDGLLSFPGLSSSIGRLYPDSSTTLCNENISSEHNPFGHSHARQLLTIRTSIQQRSLESFSFDCQSLLPFRAFIPFSNLTTTTKTHCFVCCIKKKKKLKWLKPHLFSLRDGSDLPGV